WLSVNHPSSLLPAPSAPTVSTIEVHMPALSGQVLAEEREDLLPAVEGLLDTVHRPVVIEKAVPGAVVAMKLVLLAVLFELGLVLVHLLRRRRTILVTEEAEQRAGQVLRELD